MPLLLGHPVMRISDGLSFDFFVAWALPLLTNWVCFCVTV